MDNSKNNSNRIGFMTLLFFVFLILKLTNVIDWSWWWITAPLWGQIVLGLILIFIQIFFIED